MRISLFSRFRSCQTASSPIISARGEVVIHLHAIVDAIALLGRGFMPSRAKLERAGRTKADRFFYFEEVPAAAASGQALLAQDPGGARRSRMR